LKENEGILTKGKFLSTEQATVHNSNYYYYYYYYYYSRQHYHHHHHIGIGIIIICEYRFDNVNIKRARRTFCGWWGPVGFKHVTNVYELKK